MTEHPCNGMPRAAREAFERIMIAAPANASPAIIRVLLARGVIIQHEGARGLRPFKGMRYSVPPPVRQQWLAWCDEQIANGAPGFVAGA